MSAFIKTGDKILFDSGSECYVFDRTCSIIPDASEPMVTIHSGTAELKFQWRNVRNVTAHNRNHFIEKLGLFIGQQSNVKQETQPYEPQLYELITELTDYVLSLNIEKLRSEIRTLRAHTKELERIIQYKHGIQQRKQIRTDNPHSKLLP